MPHEPGSSIGDGALEELLALAKTEQRWDLVRALRGELRRRERARERLGPGALAQILSLRPRLVSKSRREPG